MLFFFNDTATTEIYTLSLHDALPISGWSSSAFVAELLSSAPSMGDLRRFSTPIVSPQGLNTGPCATEADEGRGAQGEQRSRSEEHTSELQSRQYLVCRLLLEKKNNNT